MMMIVVEEITSYKEVDGMGRRIRKEGVFFLGGVGVEQRVYIYMPVRVVVVYSRKMWGLC